MGTLINLMLLAFVVIGIVAGVLLVHAVEDRMDRGAKNGMPGLGRNERVARCGLRGLTLMCNFEYDHSIPVFFQTLCTRSQVHYYAWRKSCFTHRKALSPTRIPT